MWRSARSPCPEMSIVGAIGVEARRYLRMSVPFEHRRPDATAGERDRQDQSSRAASYDRDIRCPVCPVWRDDR